MKLPEIVLVGQPNAGKSTVFNVLSDIKTSVSNFSGTSVEIAHSFINVHGQAFHLVDLPGVYSLNPGDEAEKVTFTYLVNEKVDLVINVVDASMLSRSLELTVELMEFGVPMVIALNMWDEAERRGLKIYPEKLEAALNIPVVTTSALYGKGIKELMEKCYDLFRLEKTTPTKMEYTSHIEKNVNQLELHLAHLKLEKNGTPRFYAIKSLETPGVVPGEILNAFAHDLEPMRLQIQEMHNKDLHETISYERHHLAMKLMEDVSHFVDLKTIPFREKVDRFFLHPYLGYFPLVFFFILFFAAIYLIGNFLGGVIGIPLGKIPGLYAGLKANLPLLWFTVDGVYQGLEGALGIVLPFFLPLILLTSLFEDTGYLSRIAFLMDGFMHKIGLHGKSVAPFVLGFGCTVPALYGIRILENKRDRILTALLLPFIPCTARTSVILALTAAFTGPWGALFIYVFILFVMGVTGKIMSLFMGKPMGLVMEIPNLKVPTLRVSLQKTWMQMKNFLKFAVPFLIVGSIFMGWLEYGAVNAAIDKVFAPAVHTVMGLPEQLGSTLVYGFFRKELVLVMANNAFGVQHLAALPLTKSQILVFIVFVTLYFPCFSTFLVMWKEFGKKVAALSALLSIAVALAAAFLVKTGLFYLKF
jgi:ferrous iron transport protein B